MAASSETRRQVQGCREVPTRRSDVTPRATKTLPAATRSTVPTDLAGNLISAAGPIRVGTHHRPAAMIATRPGEPSVPRTSLNSDSSLNRPERRRVGGAMCPRPSEAAFPPSISESGDTQGTSPSGMAVLDPSTGSVETILNRKRREGTWLMGRRSRSVIVVHPDASIRDSSITVASDH